MTTTAKPSWTFQDLLDEAVELGKKFSDAVNSSESPEEQRVTSIARDNLEHHVIEWLRTAVNGKIMSSEAVSYLEKWGECFYGGDVIEPCCPSMRLCKKTALRCYIWRDKEDALKCHHNVP